AVAASTAMIESIAPDGKEGNATGVGVAPSELNTLRSVALIVPGTYPIFNPAIPAAALKLKLAFTVARSPLSEPRIASSTIAQSSTPRAIIPTLSIDQERVITPFRLTRPKVVRNPVTRHRVEGSTIEPIVSVPMAKPTRPAEVAAAGPQDDPPLLVVGSHGFF